MRGRVAAVAIATAVSGGAVAVAPTVDLDDDVAGTSVRAFFHPESSFPARLAMSSEIADADSTELQGLELVLLDRPDGASESLVVGGLPAGISATAYDPATGLVQISGTGTVAVYQGILRNVSYSNALEPPDLGVVPRFVRVRAFDGVDHSDPVVAVVHVVPLMEDIIRTTHFEDDFDGPTLDLQKWTIVSGAGPTFSGGVARFNNTTIRSAQPFKIPGLVAQLRGVDWVSLTGTGSGSVALSSVTSGVGAVSAGRATGTVGGDAFFMTWSRLNNALDSVAFDSPFPGQPRPVVVDDSDIGFGFLHERAFVFERHASTHGGWQFPISARNSDFRIQISANSGAVLDIDSVRIGEAGMSSVQWRGYDNTGTLPGEIAELGLAIAATALGTSRGEIMVARMESTPWNLPNALPGFHLLESPSSLSTARIVFAIPAELGLEPADVTIHRSADYGMRWQAHASTTHGSDSIAAEGVAQLGMWALAGPAPAAPNTSWHLY